MKKKVLLLALVTICVSFTGCEADGGENEESLAYDTSNNENITENVETTDNIQSSNSEYMKVKKGYTVTSENGLEVYIRDTGKYHIDPDGDDYLVHDYAYLEVDITNNSDTEYTIYNGDINFYGDDYPLDTDSPPELFLPKEANMQPFSGQTISPGRKAVGRFYVACPNYDDLSVIEAEMWDVVITIKDIDEASEENNYVNDASIDYDAFDNATIENGFYVMELNNEYDGWCELSITNNDDSTYHLYISVYENGNHETSYFEGDTTLSNGNNIAYSEELGCSISVGKTDNGVNVEIVDGYSGSELNIIQGDYIQVP